MMFIILILYSMVAEANEFTPLGGRLARPGYNFKPDQTYDPPPLVFNLKKNMSENPLK